MKVRCIDKDLAFATFGREYELVNKSAKLVRIVDDSGAEGWFRKKHFEPVTDEPDKALLNLAFPCPKVDKYAEHRMKYDEGDHADYYFRSQRNEDAFSDATARLHAGLESEKVRERVKAFPPAGRNPR